MITEAQAKFIASLIDYYATAGVSGTEFRARVAYHTRYVYLSIFVNGEFRYEYRIPAQGYVTYIRSNIYTAQDRANR